MQIQSENKRAIILFVLIGILNGLLFYQLVKPFRMEGMYPVPNRDSMVFMQYARAWAEGHPYQFNIADPPTTGSTSHLYPMVLGLFYGLGAKAEALYEAAFWLNLLLFLFSIALFWKIARKVVFEGRWIATALFAASGYFGVVVSGLSDMMLFIFLTVVLWASILSKRSFCTAVTLFLLPFARPEGLVIIGIYFLLFLFEMQRSRGLSRMAEWKKKVTAVIAGGVGVFGFFLLNWLLTGMLTLDSVINKGYFRALPFLTAWDAMIIDLMNIWKGTLFALDSTFHHYTIGPIAGGCLILYGIIRTFWIKPVSITTRTLELWWLFSILGSLLMIATSGYYGVHIDRYFAWMIPLLMVYLVRGSLLVPLEKMGRQILFGCFIGFQFLTFPFYLYHHVWNTAWIRPMFDSISDARRFYPKEFTVGGLGGSGLKYFLPDWRVINLGGVTSSYFRYSGVDNEAKRIKICEHRPELRFSHFLRGMDDELSLQIMAADSQVFEIPNPFRTRLVFCTIDWQPLLDAEKVQDANVLAQLPAGSQRVDWLDAAFPVDEERCHFHVYSRYAYNQELPVLAKGKINDCEIVDAVFPILGGAFYTLNTNPGKDHWLVFRAMNKQEVLFKRLDGVFKHKINTNRVQSLALWVGDEYKMKIDLGGEGESDESRFVEQIVHIPAKAIQSERTEFGLIGDHLFCDVWLYAAP